MKESTLEKLAKEEAKRWSKIADEIMVMDLKILSFRPKEYTTRDLLDVIF